MMTAVSLKYNILYARERGLGVCEAWTASDTRLHDGVMCQP